MGEVGEVLRGTRQKLNLSVADASAATRIKPHFIEALESGEYHLLPGPAYATGFLRNYARFLGLHPDDVVQEFHAVRPAPIPGVKAATRVLASGYERQNRVRLLWVMTVVAALMLGGYAIKEYNSVHAAPPQLNLTPANLGSVHQPPIQAVTKKVAQVVRLRLHATAPVWVRVTADGRRVFQGLLRRSAHGERWSAHHTIYVVTWDGAHLQASVNGRYRGLLAGQPGLVAIEATPNSWKRVA